MKEGDDRAVGGGWRARARSLRALVPLVLVAAFVLPPLGASGALDPLNDLLSLGKGGGDAPQRAPIVRRAEPPLVATPRAKCLPGFLREPGIQGRVPAGSAKERGFHCNVRLVGHQGSSGGFKTFRYIDPEGHECAFYDTSLLYPGSALRFDNPSKGVSVLDMSNPSHPVETAKLTELPMLSPHESLNLNAKRGLLAAVAGNPATYPGMVSIYDVRSDCRHPKLQSSSLVARFGHESGFSPDGKTFYAAGTATDSITAVDVTNPKQPHSVWQGAIASHGMTLSPGGNRAYIADTSGNMLILDTSEIQARKPNPRTREVSRLTWRSATIPQNAIPFRVHGKPYVLEIDEYSAASQPTSDEDPDTVGAARIIDISDERKPRVVSNLRLQVNQPADHHAARNDPGAASPVQGYAAHYCNVPTRVNPKIVACSFIASGLRVFDISKLARPKEIGYFVAPTQPRFENGGQASDFAMSKPAFAPRRREIWYSDGTTGFYVVRVDKRVWPAGDGGSAGSSRTCAGRRATIVGTRGRDRIVGTRGRDVIVGLGGRDRIRGGGGADLICAGSGDDRVRGGGGNDRVFGGTGRDRLRGERGRDRLRGQGGKDRLAGGSGNDRISGGPRNDRLYGGRGRDRLLGGSGRDWLFGGPGSDRLRGGPGRDRLRGGPGRDRQRQ